MGERLLQYYKYIQKEAGLQGKFKLAALTKKPTTVAALEPDSQETIELFKKAITELTGKPAPHF